MFWTDGPTDPSAVPGPGPEEGPDGGWDGAGQPDGAAPDLGAPAPSAAPAEAAPAEAEPAPSADEEFLAAMAAEFDAIDATLVRLDDGTFDTCQVCGDRIGQDRLIADPVTTRCPAHS